MTSQRKLAGLILCALVGLALLIPVAEVWAGCCGPLFRSRAVGGISINPEGLIEETTPAFRQELRREMLDTADAVPQGLKPSAKLRKISLRGIDRAISEAYAHDMAVLPDEVRYLGGLQRIQYVLVYPEHNDIVLAGPGEGWKIDERGEVVGETNGRPVLQLDDLIVALRSVHAARQGGISCSIDPTADGRQRLEALMSQQRQFNPAIIGAIEQALGMQQVTLTGVPEDCRFARMMVAADYRMKRIAMKLEPSPIKGLNSFLDIAPASGSSMTPRWWLACNYEPLLRSEDGLGWELRGQGVKVLTEDEFVAEDGTVKQTGRANVPAQRWADQMTEKFNELAEVQPVFAELRNLMDLAVVAAIIEKNDLLATAKLELPMLTRAEGGATLETWNAPKTLATQSSFMKKGRNYIITASGGVQIESWQVADKSEVNAQITEVRRQAASSTSSWWWN